MRIPRFFIPHDCFDTTNLAATVSEPGIVDQILKVLRLAVDSKIDLLDGRGKIYHCSISDVQSTAKAKAKAKVLHARIESIVDESSARQISGSAFHVSVAVPILRPARFEWALEKLTELGASEIVPLVTTRSVGREEKATRWSAIVREASEQCERITLPEITPPKTLNEYLDHLKKAGDATIFICAERSHECPNDKAGAAPLHMVLCNSADLPPHKISVIVGAEGGFTAEELAFAQNAGAEPVSLGKSILRSETAAIYALAIVMAVLTDRTKAH